MVQQHEGTTWERVEAEKRNRAFFARELFQLSSVNSCTPFRARGPFARRKNEKSVANCYMLRE